MTPMAAGRGISVSDNLSGVILLRTTFIAKFR